VQVCNQLQPSAEQAMAFFSSADDGPFVMINLLKFKDKAEYADGSDANLSGREAYLRYGAAVRTELAKVGARAGYAGPVTGLLLGEVEDVWDMVALAEYPSLDAMRTMVMSASYQAIAHHRQAGLAGQLNIKTLGTFGA
jgi:uncharacterized protein (DUF1330 family)